LLLPAAGRISKIFVPIIREVRPRYFAAEHPPASTLVAVTALARPELLVEVEAVAVLP
jgi:enamine deaminase RidA (YjgF/YER057c/UK114 family)